MGEISFCAYNTGVGWRQIVENMHKNATVAEWYREHGKHPVYANPRKPLPLPDHAQPVSLKIPKNGRLVEWKPGPGAHAAPSVAAGVGLASIETVPSPLGDRTAS